MRFLSRVSLTKSELDDGAFLINHSLQLLFLLLLWLQDDLSVLLFRVLGHVQRLHLYLHRRGRQTLLL